MNLAKAEFSPITFPAQSRHQNLSPYDPAIHTQQYLKVFYTSYPAGNNNKNLSQDAESTFSKFPYLIILSKL